MSAVDEETPLLAQQQDGKPTPLPKLTFSLMLLMQLCEPMVALVIYPFIAELIASLPITGGDTRKIGYYAGLIESSFFAVEAMTILQWSRASDYVGRKPILLIGLTGLCISTTAFGLSTTFPALVISRAICGLLNGNVGVMKTMLGEITDSTNRAQAFSYMPAIWALGCTLGPFIGGTLAHPHERFPKLFTSQFWVRYPYFLPCFVPTIFTIIVIILAALFLEETVPNKKLPSFLKWTSKRAKNSDPDTTTLTPGAEIVNDDSPPPLRQLLTFPIVVSVTNYNLIAFLDIMLQALRPLFYAVPIEVGGFGLSPATIGLCLALCGIASGLVQMFCCAPCIRRFGPRSVFMAGISASFLIFSLFPLIHLVARAHGGRSRLAWTLVAIQLGLSPVMDMCFATVFMYVTASAPSNRSLGAINGMAQTTTSVCRAVGPALVSTLFALSTEHKVLGGYGVYAFLACMSMGSLGLASLLPPGMWEH